jgi:hypothetical protein
MLREFSVTLLAGSAAHQLRDVYLGAYAINDHAGSSSAVARQYGGSLEVHALVRLLWSTSQATASSNADNAKLFARAALVLAAREDFKVGMMKVRDFATDPDFIRIAALSDNEAAQLREAATDYTKQIDRFGEAYGKPLRLIWALPKSKGNIPPDVVLKIFDAMDECRRTATTYDAYFQLIELPWRFRNLTVERGDKASTAAIDAYLDRWRSEVDDRFVRRWLLQAKELKGPPPIIIDPSRIQISQ